MILKVMRVSLSTTPDVTRNRSAFHGQVDSGKGEFCKTSGLIPSVLNKRSYNIFAEKFYKKNEPREKSHGLFMSNPAYPRIEL
jgi:hypothetical protein